ncbi:MAG: hypothetical protein QOI77_2879 [Blastocatellia bacterium]|nr:hypothetical protein [Blastocatellia bacterium]
MMESLGGRLLMPSPSSESSPHSDSEIATRGSTPNLVSVLKDEAGAQRITMLGPVGSGAMGGEYLAEISIDEPAMEQPRSNETLSAWRADDQTPTQPLTPPASVSTGALPDDFISKTFGESTSVNTGALPADFVPTETFGEPASLSAGALPDDFIPSENFSEPASVNTGALPADFAAQPETPLYLDENVQFTVYRPKTIVPQKWYSLLAFAHLSEKREDAPEDEPDPVAEVRQQAQRILGEQAAEYQNLTQDTLQAIPREGTITFLPTMPGIEFNPPSRSFTWEESVHREDFRLRAKRTQHDGRVLKGRLSVFLGSILLADIPLSIRVDTHEPSKKQKTSLEEVHARPYRKIFASYSHRDIEVVEQFERLAQALGDRYLRDVTYLRSGEMWNDKLEEMILEADIFQLFWSSNSMTSPFVRQEWEYALTLQRPNFIRPTYWEEPLPIKPDQKLPPEELMRLHFQRIHRGGDSPAPNARPVLASPLPSATPTQVSLDGNRAVEREREITLSGDPEIGEALSSFWDKRPREKARRGVGGSESAPASAESPLERTKLWTEEKGRSGIGSSGRVGIGGSYSDEHASAKTGPLVHRPPAAAPPPATTPPPATPTPGSFSPSIQYSSRSGAGGRRLDFGDVPPIRSKSPLVPLLIVAALGLLALMGVLLYFLFG